MEIKKPLRMSLVTQIIDEMEDKIMKAVWKVGDKIPGEMELMKNFGVSRSTMREAIQALSSLRMIETRQGVGAYVISKNRFDASIRNHLENININETLEARKLIESSIIGIAAERRTQEDIELLEQLLKRRNEDFDSIEPYIEADRAFHFKIAQISHNVLLYDIYKTLYGYVVELFFAQYEYSQYDSLNKSHTDLFNYIKEGDVKNAQKTVRFMIREERKLFIKMGLIES